MPLQNLRGSYALVLSQQIPMVSEIIHVDCFILASYMAFLSEKKKSCERVKCFNESFNKQNQSLEQITKFTLIFSKLTNFRCSPHGAVTF